MLNSLAWGLAKQIDPQFAVAEVLSLPPTPGCKVGAFENYTRGLVETDPAEQIRHLKEAVRLDPTFSPALFALGKAYFANQQFEFGGHYPGTSAAQRSQRPGGGLRSWPRLFLSRQLRQGGRRLRLCNKQLPLPEVVNNQGVAASRRGQDASSFFPQAVAADPNDPDYQFNLAVALSRKKDVAGALRASGKR